MLEVICLIWLWKVNGRNALAHGQKPGKYRALTLMLWFGLEIMGSMMGALMADIISPGSDSMMLAYMFGIVGAAIGGMLSYQLAKHSPQGDFKPEEMYGQLYGQQWGNLHQQEGYLMNPATIRIVEEAGGYEDAGDVFFLNGYPVCSLAPGNEYTFVTQYVKNVLTIGRPTQTMGDSAHEVHFVAAENGYIEVHARAGELLPQEFKNYTSQ